MKVTIIIADELVSEVKEHTGGKTITDAITTALEGWLAMQKMKALNWEVRENPLDFRADFTAESVRKLNRR